MSININIADWPQSTLLSPAADAAGRTSASAVSLKYAHKAYVIFILNQANAATIACSVNQCTSVAKAGSKAIPSVPIWTNLDEATASPLTRQTDAASYTTDAATKQKRVIFEIDPRGLDQANGFDCISVTTGASNVANITACEVVLLPRQTGANVPNILAD